MEMIEIEAFLAVSSEGQFTRAALVLRLSQPAVSRRIETLEHELGVRLFDRLPQGARLTAAGVAFRPFAERMAAAASDGKRAVREGNGASPESITLALVGTLASTALPGRLRAVRDRSPGLRLTLRTARSDGVSELVRRGEADLGLRYFADPAPTIVSRSVWDEELVVVAAPDLSLAGEATIQLPDLAAQPWVSYPVGVASTGEPFARLLLRHLGSLGFDPASNIEIDSLTSQKRLIEAGFGLGMVPASAVQEEVRLGSLVILPVPAMALTVPVVAIYRRDGYLSPATVDLLDVLGEGPNRPSLDDAPG